MTLTNLWRSSVLVVATFLVACSGVAETISATINGNSLKLEVARTQNEHAQGLMYRREMDRNAGMLFIFPEAKERTFWMKNTVLSLDIIFIDEQKKVLGVVEKAVPFSTKSVGVEGASKYVIEVNAGVARELGIVPGTKVVF